jgi:predicted porin
MGVYNLSKRTAAYAAIADFKADAAGEKATANTKVQTIGLFHKF